MSSTKAYTDGTESKSVNSRKLRNKWKKKRFLATGKLHTYPLSYLMESKYEHATLFRMLIRMPMYMKFLKEDFDMCVCECVSMCS